MSSLPNFTTEEVGPGIKDPILIVDRSGFIGREIVFRLGSSTQIVFVSKTRPQLTSDYSKNFLFVPFTKKHPTIPDGKYSAFFVLDDEESNLRDSLVSFVQRAEKDKTPIVYGVSIKEASKPFIKQFLEKHIYLKILIYGEVIDEKLSAQGLTSDILRSAFLNKRIVLPKDGLESIYPVFIKDVAISFLEVVFGSPTPDRLFFAFPLLAPTALSLARVIQKNEPDVKIDFSTKKENFPTPLSLNGAYLLPSNYSLENKIKKIFSDFNNLKKPSLLIKKKNSPPFPIKSFLLSIAFFVLLPFVTTLSFLLIGFLSLWQAHLSLSSSDMHRVSFFAKSASDSFTGARATFELLNLEASILGMSSFSFVLGQNIEAGKDLSKALYYSVDSYEKFKKVFSGKTSNSSKDFSDANVELSNALVLIEKTKANKDVSTAIKNEINKNNDLINLASSVRSVLPELVGVNDKRNYLILFQNNMELRPNGGFIGSYGILSINKGKLLDFTVSDVYDADGQLKGHIEPPFPIRRYLPSEHWYLRDSNFDIDFPKSASQAAFFINVEKNQNVDGVIAINLSFVKSLLKIMGSVDIPEYNQTVTSDNFFKLAQEHSEKNFFPGSTQKKDFLGAVFRAVQGRVSDKKVSYVALAKSIEQGIENKNILLSSSNPYVQGLFTLNNWSGSIYDNRKVASSRVNDFLQINEANLGVNKVNYFIERKVSKNVSIGESGQIASELNISYKNKSDGSWPGGNYKNYIRIALPLGAKISLIKINGVEQQIVEAIADPKKYESKTFVRPDGLEVDSYQENEKQIYGFLLNVPQQKSIDLIVNYVLPVGISIPSLSSVYNLRLIKQPGVDFIPLNLTISYPESLKVAQVSTNLQKLNSAVKFKRDIVKDEDFEVLFSSK